MTLSRQSRSIHTWRPTSIGKEAVLVAAEVTGLSDCFHDVRIRNQFVRIAFPGLEGVYTSSALSDLSRARPGHEIAKDCP